MADEPSTENDRFLFRGPMLCRARRPLVAGLLLGLALAVLAIVANS